MPMIHNWYLEKYAHHDGQTSYLAWGNVTGHDRLADTTFIHTSEVMSTRIDEENEECIIQTRNTEYHCRLSECNYDMPDSYEVIAELEKLRKKYSKKKQYKLEDNSVLIVLSDHEEYYFECALVKENGIILAGGMSPHIGTFQDSCLIRFDGFGRTSHTGIDIRYFPHYAHLEAYAWDTEGFSVYLENAGESTIFFSTPEGVIELLPKERKLVSKENTISDEDKPFLSGADLYPAVFIDETPHK